jgi:hypothetical protein
MAGFRDLLGDDAALLPEPPSVDPLTLTTRGERIEYIAALMRSLDFDGNVTTKALARTWGLAWSTVRDYAALASRLARAEDLSPDRTATECAAVFRISIGRLLQSRQYQHATGSARALAELAGAIQPKHAIIRAAESPLAQAWQGLPENPSERLAVLQAARRQIEALEISTQSALESAVPALPAGDDDGT